MPDLDAQKHNDALSKVIPQEIVASEGRRGTQRKSWIDNLKKWTGLNIFTFVVDAEDKEIDY